MARLEQRVVDVHGDDVALADEIEQVREVERSASRRVTDLNDDLQPRGVNNLLVDPGVQNVLARFQPHPGNLLEEQIAMIANEPFTQAAASAVAIVLAHRLQLRGKLLKEKAGIFRQQLAVARQPGLGLW